MATIKNPSEAFDEQAKKEKELNKKLAEDTAAASKAYTAEQERIDNQLEAANKTASDYYRTQYNAGLKTLADIYDAEQNKIKQEEEESKARENSAREAGIWTGATNFAASLVNLFGVANGAANQTYKSPSLDWMKQADTIRREGKVRMDQLAERQKALQMQIEQMKLADAKQGLEDARQGALTRYNSRSKAAERAYADQVSAAKLAYTGAQKAAELEARGKVADLTHQETMANINRQEAQFKAGMQAKGYNADGTINPKLMETIQKYSSTTGSGDKQKVNFPVLDKDGNINIARMKPQEFEEIVDIAKGCIEGELGKSEAEQFSKEMRMASTEKDKAAVIKKWWGKSPSVGIAIKTIDANYKGNHGDVVEEETPKEETPKVETKQSATDNKKGKSTKDLIDAL